MSAEIIDFRTAHRGQVAAATEAHTRPKAGLTTTAKNLHLRQERFEEWRRLQAAVDYWGSWLKFEWAVDVAVCQGVQEANSDQQKFNNKSRLPALDSYRQALCELLLAPAPNVASVNWKRTKLKDPYLGVKKQCIEQAIADDVAFLDAHPTRRSRKVEQA